MNLPALPNRQSGGDQHHNASNAVHACAFPAVYFGVGLKKPSTKQSQKHFRKYPQKTHKPGSG
jgi:hypothetical protein